MKISPVKNYKKPAYALKLAALIAAAASLSGCAENNGAAVTTEEPATSNTAQTQEGTAPAYQETTTAAPETTISGTVTTVETTTECLDDTELAGEADIPEETAPQITEEITEGITAAVTAAVTSAAVSTAVTSEDCLVEGVMQAPEENYTEPELEGDVAAPEEDDELSAIDKYVTNGFQDFKSAIDTVTIAKAYRSSLMVEFDTADGGSFESPAYVQLAHGCDAPAGNEYLMYDDTYLFFVDKNSAENMEVFTQIKGAKQVSFGYLAEGSHKGFRIKAAVVIVEYTDDEIDLDIMDELIKAGWLVEAEINPTGLVQSPGDEGSVDEGAAVEKYVDNNFDTIKKKVASMTEAEAFKSHITVKFETKSGVGFTARSDISVEPYTGNTIGDTVYLFFVSTKDKELYPKLTDIKDASSVTFRTDNEKSGSMKGYLAYGSCDGFTIKAAVIPVDDLSGTISEDDAAGIVYRIYDKWLIKYDDDPTVLDGDVEIPEEDVDTRSHDYAVRSIETLKTAFKELDLTAVIPNEDESETKWVGANGYSIYANLDVGLNSSFVSYTPIYLSFIDTNDKETLDTLKKMGATEYKYGFFKEEAGFNGDRIMIVFVEVASFDGKLGANAAKKLVAELKTTAALEFEAADAELEGEPVIDEEN